MANQNDSAQEGGSAQPAGGADRVETGWQHYSRKEYFRAEADFQKALEGSPGAVDTLYALAMTYAASGRPQEAVQAFGKVLVLLQNPQGIDLVRVHMLVRLAQGHINHIQTGDWDLRK